MPKQLRLYLGAAFLLIFAFDAFAQGAPVINEFLFDYDNNGELETLEFIEVFGSPNTDYSAYSVLEIVGNSDKNPGSDRGYFPDWNN